MKPRIIAGVVGFAVGVGIVALGFYLSGAEVVRGEKMLAAYFTFLLVGLMLGACAGSFVED